MGIGQHFENSFGLCVEMSGNNDNNFAPSLPWSLFEIIGDCFGTLVFRCGSCAPSMKYFAQNNHL